MDSQERELTEYCRKNNYEVIAVYREDHSAKNFNRPEFKKLLAFLKKNRGKVDQLLVTTWCRFSRNVPESYAMIEQLKIYGVEVQAIEQPIDLSIPENYLILAVFLAML